MFNKDELIELKNLLLHGFGESVKRIATFQKINELIRTYDAGETISYFHCCVCKEDTSMETTACPVCDAQAWEHPDYPACEHTNTKQCNITEQVLCLECGELVT